MASTLLTGILSRKTSKLSSFFEFEHEQKFQEIWADMPVRGKKTKEEQDAFYQAFFVKVQELLQERGRVFLFCNENGIAKKYLRLNPCLHLKQEFCIREKDGAYFFIIEMRECAKQPEDAPQEALEDSDSGKEGTVQEAGKEQEGQQ